MYDAQTQARVVMPESMTVAALITALQALPSHLDVTVYVDGGTWNVIAAEAMTDDEGDPVVMLTYAE